MKTCFFIGHRDTPENVREALQIEIEKCIVEHGVTRFIVGHYGNFDHLAAAAVIAAKNTYPHISLTLLLPYHPTERPIKLSRGFDDSFYPENLETVPRRYAIPYANRAVVKSADYVIAYVRHAASNAREVVDFARRRSIPVRNIAQDYP